MPSDMYCEARGYLAGVRIWLKIVQANVPCNYLKGEASSKFQTQQKPRCRVFVVFDDCSGN